MYISWSLGKGSRLFSEKNLYQDKAEVPAVFFHVWQALVICDFLGINPDTFPYPVILSVGIRAGKTER